MRMLEIFSEDLIQEEPVISSWIEDLEFMGDPDINDIDDVEMELLNGRSYVIKDVPYEIYYDWVTAPSKGKFWHDQIRDYYTIH